MRNPFLCCVGGVVSADIAVPEHERELDFYSKILTTGDKPLWQADLLNNLGTPIIGLGQRVPEYDALPLQWMPHIQVADVAASVANALEMGGKVIMQSSADAAYSWAALSDTNGSAFGIIPVAEESSAYTPTEEHFGRISWLSLASPDPSSSSTFYQRVIGWTPGSKDGEGGTTNDTTIDMHIDDQTVAAEIRKLQDDQTHIPTAWLIHVPVGDLAESLRRVGEGGGEVIETCDKTNSAVIRDPIGVYLALQSG